ncbi:rod-binding protein [Methylobacterium sp. E-066]|uniref:rod-binding protein n=1 Tax=Methylobacterium sp. E-066 TaxID=2836584 RepID=UPI001FB8BE84|nr:rod-binding protein [Methylobacterium sp. E-066]MCJ2140894.1 rod-binding protein [Methylobacterium sp. E-066]
MSVQPPSDIVLDVARAADPTRYQAAVTKLTQGSPGTFADALGAAGGAGIAAAPQGNVDTILTRFRTAATLPPPRAKGTPPQEFEAFVLQTFIESMLPQNATAVFGKGNAGSIWKSMMAEQIGAQIAKAGGIGIARMLEAAHPPTAAADAAAKPDPARIG